MVSSSFGRIVTARYVIYFFFSTVLFLSNFMFAKHCSKSISVDLLCDAEDNRDVLKRLIQKPILIEQITYESDVEIQEEEFYYLVDLKEGEIYSANDIALSVFYLFKKNKFSKITFHIDDGVFGKILKFKMFGFWTFKKLKLQGVMIGGYKYQQYYMISPSDPFDEEKHKLSLKKISNALAEEGYFEGYVTSDLLKEYKTKSIVVNLQINRGPRFSIKGVNAQVKKNKSNQKKLGIREFDSYKKKINFFLADRFLKKSYSKKLINKETAALKRFLERNGFLNISIELREYINYENKTIELYFILDFLEKRQFVFWGNKFFNNEQLLNFILLFGRSASLVPASVLSEAIEREYRVKGFWDVKIDIEEEKGRDFFIIEEGERVSIKEIVLKGVNNFSSSYLMKKCLRSIIRAQFFDELMVKKKLENLLHFYKSNGFWSCKILKEEFVLINKKKRSYRLEIVIDEGKKTFLRKVSIPNFPEIMNFWPFHKFSKEEDIFFDPGLVKYQRLWIKNYFTKQGYPFAVVTPDIEQYGNSVELCWNIDLGDSDSVFGKTILLGCCTVPFKVIQKELSYKEGQPFSRDKLKLSRDRFRALNIFDQVHLNVIQSNFLKNKKVVLLKLNQDDPFEIRLRAGVGLQQVTRKFAFSKGATYKLGGTVLVKNPFNLGDNFFADMDFARSHRSVSFEYMQPYLIGLPVKTRLKLYATRYEQPGFIGCKKNLYDVAQKGFLFGIRDKYFCSDIGINIGFEWMFTGVKTGLENFSHLVAEAIRFESCLLDNSVPHFFIEPAIIVDKLDNKLNPTSGFFILLTAKGMFPVSQRYFDTYFVKLMTEQSLFFSFNQKIVFAFHLRVGHIFNRDFKNIFPFERFYLGGANSIRSYETDMCPPLGYFTDSCGEKYIVPQGGKSLFHCNLEIRFPMVGPFGATLFHDFGKLIGQPNEVFDFSNFLVGTGFGLRYNTPFGPLRFDIGWKWRSCKFSAYSYSWFLTFGNSF